MIIIVIAILISIRVLTCQQLQYFCQELQQHCVPFVTVVDNLPALSSGKACPLALALALVLALALALLSGPTTPLLYYNTTPLLAL